MSSTKFRKGQLVRYPLNKLSEGHKVQAIVRRVHRDGTVTVEAYFLLNPTGERSGGFLGYRYRYDASLLEAA